MQLTFEMIIDLGPGLNPLLTLASTPGRPSKCLGSHRYPVSSLPHPGSNNRYRTLQHNPTHLELTLPLPYYPHTTPPCAPSLPHESPSPSHHTPPCPSPRPARPCIVRSRHKRQGQHVGRRAVSHLSASRARYYSTVPDGCMRVARCEARTAIGSALRCGGERGKREGGRDGRLVVCDLPAFSHPMPWRGGT